MSAYAVELAANAERQLRKLEPAVRTKIAGAIRQLADDPRPRGCKKLSGRHEQWRIEVAHTYRVIYEIHDKVLIVTVIEIGHRREVYER